MDKLRTVVGPAIATVKGIQVFYITVEPLLREFASILLQAQVCKHSEPEPVGVWHAEGRGGGERTLALIHGTW